MVAQPVSSGSVVARRYRATRRIAAGAMGEVWEGVHVELGHRVALKVLRKEALACREMVRRFEREAFLLARVQSEHVVRVIDFVSRGRHGPVLVMELVEGPTFADVLHHERPSLEQIVSVAIDVLRGLRAMHASDVIHRDVKPGNVVLRPGLDGTRRAVLVDLGVGRLREEDVCDDNGDVPVVLADEITTADRVVGTLEYMPPEQILSSQTAEATVDIYAVGAMIWRAIAGEHPFPDKHGLELVREKVKTRVPRVRCPRHDAAGRRLEAIVARAMEFKPVDRWPNDDAMIDALEEVRAELRARPAAGTEPDPEEVATSGRVARRRARSIRRKALLAVAAACATAVAAYSSYTWHQPPPRAASVVVP